MIAILRHFDTPLLKFSVTEDSSDPEIQILWANEGSRQLLPLDMQPTEEGVRSWLKHRPIPKNRAYVHSFLSKCGLSPNRPIGIIRASKGLSLNDCYWVVEEGFEGTFADNNLYDNNFSRILAQIAFTGYGSSARLVSSPEFTTNGMLPKCWRRINGKVWLYKGGTSGASNTGNEPYSEFFAAQIAQVIGIHAISYRLAKWKGELCSACELFTSKDLSYLPVGRVVERGGMRAVEAYYAELGDAFVNALHDMFVLDAIICNTDRHFGNFGFFVDAKTNQIIAPAPLFDHGNSLFNFAGLDDVVSVDTLRKYASTQYPCAYDDFMGTARKVLAQRHREGLRKLVNFRFKQNPTYKLPPKRLALIEKIVQERAKELLN